MVLRPNIDTALAVGLLPVLAAQTLWVRTRAMHSERAIIFILFSFLLVSALAACPGSGLITLTSTSGISRMPQPR